MLGYEVSVRPTATPASTNVHGPWQIAPTGFPELTKSRTNETAELSRRSLSGFTVPPGNTNPSNSSTEASDTARSTGKLPAGLQIMVACLNFTGFQRQQFDFRPRLLQRRARLLEFHFLHPVGRQDGNSLALQFV